VWAVRAERLPFGIYAPYLEHWALISSELNRCQAPVTLLFFFFIAIKLKWFVNSTIVHLYSVGLFSNVSSPSPYGGGRSREWNTWRKGVILQFNKGGIPSLSVSDRRSYGSLLSILSLLEPWMAGPPCENVTSLNTRGCISLELGRSHGLLGQIISLPSNQRRDEPLIIAG